MGTATHTPGPWKYEDYGQIVMTGDGQMSVADIRGYGTLMSKFGCEEAVRIMDANGRMIAAAPEVQKRFEAASKRASRRGLMLDEILDQKDRIEQLIEDHPPGTFQHRLAETLLDVLVDYENSLNSITDRKTE